MWESCPECAGLIEPGTTVCPHCHVAFDQQADETWEPLYNVGRRLIDKKHYDQAIVQLSQALVEAPDDQVAKVFVARADAYIGQGDLQRAVDDSTQAIEHDAFYVDAYACRATALAGQKQWRGAVDDHATVIRLSPTVSDEYLDSVKSMVADALADYDRQAAGGASPQLFQDRGAAYALIGRHDLAVGELTKALNGEPGNVVSHLFRAKSYAALGKHKEVISDCTAVIEKGRPNAEAHFARGRAFGALGKHDWAVADLTKATKLDPSMVAAYYELGTVHEAMGQPAKAIDAYSNGVAVNAYALNCYLARGRLRAEQGDDENAIRDFSRALQLDSADAQTYCRRAASYVELGMHDAAQSDYDAAVRLDPMCAEAFCGRGNVQLALLQYQAAIAELTKALRLNPKLGAAYENRGQAYLASGNLPAAVKDLTRALDLAPAESNTGEVLYYRGLAYLDQDLFNEALADLDGASRKIMPSAELFEHRGRAKAGLRRWYDAVCDLDRAIELEPQNAGAFRGRQQAYHQKAVEDFGRRINRGETSPLSFRFRGLAYQGLGQTDAALADFRQALKLDDKDVAAHVGVAMIQAKTGANDKAVAHLTRAIACEAGNPHHHYQRGVALVRLGKLQKGFKDLSAALKLDPKHVKARLARCELLTRAGKFAEAAADLNVAKKLAPHEPLCHLASGRFYAARSQFDKAIEQFTKTAQIDPKSAEAYHGRGEARKALGQLDEAIADFETAIKLNSRSVESYSSRGLCFAQQKKYDKAIIELTKAAGGVRFHRKFGAVYETRAQIRFLIGRYDEAAEDLTTTIHLKPEGHRFDRTLCGRGLAYLKLDQFDKAEKDFKLALKVNPQSDRAKRCLEWMQGDRAATLPELRDAKVVVPYRKPAVVTQGYQPEDEAGAWDTIPLWDQWILCDGGGAEYGPVTKAELDAWCAEGRIDDRARLLRIDQPKWLWVGDVYADLALESYRTRSAPVPVTSFAGEEEPEEEFDYEPDSAISVESLGFGEPSDEDYDVPDIRV